MSLSSLCSTQTLRFERSTVTVDDSGGQIITWNVITGLESVPVSLQPGPARVKNMFGQRNISYTNAVYADHDLGITKGDRGVEIKSGRIFVLEAVENAAGRDVMFAYAFREIV